MSDSGKGGKGAKHPKDARETKGRSTAEWTTFAIASAVVALVVGLILSQVPGRDMPAAPEARVVGEPQQRSGGYVVSVKVRNQGDTTAENVQIVAELKVGEETFEADQVVDFLSGGESEDVEFAFEQDPREGEVSVRVASWGVP